MTSLLHLVVSAILLLQWNVAPTAAFRAARTPTGDQQPQQLRVQRIRQQQQHRELHYGRRSVVLGANEKSEAERLLAKAKAIRESLPDTAAAADDGASTSNSNESTSAATRQEGNRIVSKFSLPSPQSSESNFRLYLDIGRESGTWMDPRWGASGRRIECTLDIAFPRPSTSATEEEGATTIPQPATEEITAGLIKTVTTKSSTLSPVYKLQSAPFARLRGGFDEMKIIDGGYCVESSATASLSSSSTLRFCIDAVGTTDLDVTIPEGKLYFALPYFGLRTERGGGGDDSRSASKMELSNKEGTITVKQMGWHTGWYREESRILGVFRAVPLEKARGRDKF